jgi:hypothetical protein
MTDARVILSPLTDQTGFQFYETMSFPVTPNSTLTPHTTVTCLKKMFLHNISGDVYVEYLELRCMIYHEAFLY